MPHLVYQAPGSKKPIAFQVHKRVTSIGSGTENDLVLDDADVSETHGFVRFDGRTFTLQCIGTNDVIINGKRRAKHMLEHGDELLIGSTCLTFHLYRASVQRAEEEQSDLVQSYRRILEFSQVLLTEKPIPELLEELMDSIIELTHADRGFLILGQDEEMHVRVARKLDKENIEDAISQLSDSIVSTVVRNRQPLIVADALNDRDFGGSKSVVNLKLCSVMCVPLIDRDRFLGLIYVGNDNVVNLFTQAHLSTLTIYAAQASLIIAKALAMDELRLDNRRLRERIDDMRFGSLIGSCNAMKEVYRRVAKVAPTDVSVLILGETGTGKELIARELHARSDRANGPFVTINCGAIPENLLESELFGHVRGAFTGASATRSGKFQAAAGGTLFLDEIGEMPVNLQVKILRALQDRTVTKVGDTRPERVDLRIIAATHRDLGAMISDGSFREDLYYRLNVVTLTLPPLRDRGDDVEIIARYFLDKYLTEFDTAKKRFNGDAIIAMRKFSWPGNIRQLENHIKKAIILSERSGIRAEDLDLREGGEREILPLADAQEAWKSSYIREVLELNAGNRTKTARDLGVDPRTIFRFLEKEAEREPEA